MKKYILLSFLAGIGLCSGAQTTIQDSIQTGPAYANDVYYSFKTGMVKESVNSDWQIALGMGVFNVAVRTNATTSSSGSGSVSVYEMPGKDTSRWATFDTTGYKSWHMNENSDEDWEMGSLNYNSLSDDYGWGGYNATTHEVTGHRLYLFAINTATGMQFRKVFITAKVLGTWTLKYANLDGSGEYSFTVASTGYPTKNFVYVNMITNLLVDREPAKSDWDFVLTRYRALQTGTSTYYPSTGILTNTGVVVAEARGVTVDAAQLAEFIGDTSDNISIIGADWKKLAGTTYSITDSLCYFVKARDGAFWKLAFTSFAGSSTGKVVFNKTRLTPPTGLSTSANSNLSLVIYPNPANEKAAVVFDAPQSNTEVTVMDINGRPITHLFNIQKGFQEISISLDGFQTGIYLVEVKSGSNRSVQRLLVN